jgi:hypothetical protein
MIYQYQMHGNMSGGYQQMPPMYSPQQMMMYPQPQFM